MGDFKLISTVSDNSLFKDLIELILCIPAE